VNIEGVIPALLTALDADGRINPQEVRRLAAHLVEQGANGFFVCGSAGEGVYMSAAERRQVVELVADEVAGQVPIIAQVGAISTEEAVELARDARAAGAAAVASLPPILFRVPWEAVVAHIRAVAEAADLPTYYYHIPGLTGVQATADELADLAARVPNFAGVKLSSPDLFLLWGFLDRCASKHDILYGCDQQLFQGLMTGARGGIGSTYNYQIENVVGLYRAVQKGDHAAAMQYQNRINQVVEILFRFGGNRAVEKAMTTLRGFPVGPPRRPNLPFAEEKIPALRRELEQMGMLP
jgi:N-acetylneuraminate lyase